MSTAALQDVWNGMIAYNLSTADKRWLAEHLLQQVEEDSASQTAEQFRPYTMEEINAMTDNAERGIAAGEVYSLEEVRQMRKNDIAKKYHLSV